MKKRIVALAAIAMLMGCGSDRDGDGDPDRGDERSMDSLDIEAIAGVWADTTVTDGTANDAFIVLRFDGSAANGAIVAASANDEGLRCPDEIFRSITTADDRSFSAEGLVANGSGTEWVPATLTLNDTEEIAVTYACEGCSPALDVLARRDDDAEPLVPVLIQGDILSDRTLTNVICDSGEPDYRVRGVVGIDALVSVEPGVIVEFESNAGFEVNEFGDGALQALGTRDERVVFTGAIQTPGFWRGLVIRTDDGRNELRHVTVQYAGSDVIADDIKDGLTGGIAVNVEPGSVAASLKLTDAIVRENEGYGLIVEWFGRLREFSNNTFSNNTAAAVIAEAGNVGALDAASSYTGGNGFEGVEIARTGAANSLREDATWPAFDDGSTYYVSGSVVIEATLTIAPGATLAFEAGAEMVFGVPFGRPEGVIRALGTSSTPITFTGWEKTRGFWKGIVIQSVSNQNAMRHCVVEYGGSEAIFGGTAANVSLDVVSFAPSLTISNSRIRDSDGCGIYVQSGGPGLDESDNTFSNNRSGEVCF